MSLRLTRKSWKSSAAAPGGAGTSETFPGSRSWVFGPPINYDKTGGARLRARRVGCALRTLYLSPAALVRTGFFRGTPASPIIHNFSRQREAAKFFVIRERD
jgi:hypothetical protein